MFRFGRLTVDIGLLPPGAFFGALVPRVCAAQSLVFTFGGCPLAFVRELLSFVCQLLTTVRDLLSSIRDVISSGSKQFAPFDLSFTPQEGLLTLVKPVSPVFGRPGIGLVLRDHNSA